jgi:hypothetical protein
MDTRDNDEKSSQRIIVGVDAVTNLFLPHNFL